VRLGRPGVLPLPRSNTLASPVLKQILAWAHSRRSDRRYRTARAEIDTNLGPRPCWRHASRARIEHLSSRAASAGRSSSAGSRAHEGDETCLLRCMASYKQRTRKGSTVRRSSHLRQTGVDDAPRDRAAVWRVRAAGSDIERLEHRSDPALDRAKGRDTVRFYEVAQYASGIVVR
jgi:hypothetical protein